MYRRGYAAMGEPIDYFLFLCVEKEPPHAVTVCYVDDAALERGEALLARDMDTLARCVASGEWPGYSSDLTPVSLPAWAFYV
jgi:exodeoxyribonuclease VIII